MVIFHSYVKLPEGMSYYEFMSGNDPRSYHFSFVTMSYEILHIITLTYIKSKLLIIQS